MARTAYREMLSQALARKEFIPILVFAAMQRIQSQSDLLAEFLLLEDDDFIVIDWQALGVFHHFAGRAVPATFNSILGGGRRCMYFLTAQKEKDLIIRTEKSGTVEVNQVRRGFSAPHLRLPRDLA